MTDLLTCTVISNHECAIAYLDTELEISSVDWLADRLSPLAAEGRDVVLNLAALRFLGAAGLHALVDLEQQATATGGIGSVGRTTGGGVAPPECRRHAELLWDRTFQS